MTTNPTRLGELTAYDLGSTITFHDGGATYTGSLISVKHEFPDGKRRTFLMIVSGSGKWRHADRYPSNLPIDEIVRPVVRHDPAPVATSGRAIGGPVSGPGTGGGAVINSIVINPPPAPAGAAIRASLIAHARENGLRS